MTEDEVWENFQSQMRKSTKGVHDIQDVAINGLFVLRSVWWKKIFIYVYELIKFYHLDDM